MFAQIDLPPTKKKNQKKKNHNKTIILTKKKKNFHLLQVCLRAIGGEAGAASSLAPKVGPLGLSPKKVGDDIAKETKDWKGLKVTVKLTIQNRIATVSVVPSAAALLIRALKEAPRDRKKVKNVQHNGDVPLDEVYEIARVMRPRSLAKEFKGTVKEVLGTANSVGCTIGGKSPTAVQAEIDAGTINVPSK